MARVKQTMRFKPTTAPRHVFTTTMHTQTERPATQYELVPYRPAILTAHTSTESERLLLHGPSDSKLRKAAQTARNLTARKLSRRPKKQ